MTQGIIKKKDEVDEVITYAYDDSISAFLQSIPAVYRVHHKLLLPIFIILLLVVGLVGALYLSQQEQDPRQRAASTSYPPGTVAVIDGQAITEQYLRNKALEQYRPEAITKEVLSIMLEAEIEKRLLEKQAKSQGLNMSDAATMGQARMLYPDEELTPAMIEQSRYLLLKEDVSKSLSKTREAYTIGFWLPPEGYGIPLTSEQQRTITAQRQLVPQFTAQVKQRLANNEAPLAIAQDLLRTYPVLRPVLAVNGYLLDTTENEELLTTPMFYTYDDENLKNPLFPALFSMQTGQVREIVSPSTSGALVVKVISATDGQYDNYEAWLSKVKQQSVQIINPL